jgi:cytidyltransferase-like protein
MKKVLVTGSFNVVHPGHLRLLRFAKECGDKLIVGVLSDEIAGSAAHVIQDLRMEGVRSISWVDEVVLVDQSIESVILEKRPNVIVKGREYEKVFNLEKELVENYGGKIIFSSGEVGFSSLDLIRKESLLSAHQNIVLPELFMERHNIDVHKLTELIHNFSKVRVCIVGDLIVDEYINCQPLGMSQEDPTIVVTPVDNALYLGGAAIVAAHAAALGSKVNFFS